MPTLPLAVKLKRRLHRDVAAAQDLMVIGAYEAFPDAVIHGGTAIWRCFGGNRFSDVVDFYLPGSARGKLAPLSADLEKYGLTSQKLKETSNAVFAKFGRGSLSISFEASFRMVKEPVVRPFEMADGSFITVRTLRPEELLREKALAYEGRRRVRDLYDVYFLLQIAEPTDSVGESVLHLLGSFEKPVDEGELKTLIISGSAPRTSDMLEAIESWAK